MILRTLMLAALVAPAFAPEAQAATIGTGQVETFLGCPAGFGMITLPDPRGQAAPSALGTPRADQLLVVQCVSQQVVGSPTCPPGTVRTAQSGRDVCTQPPRRPGGSAIADGTSNTISSPATGISDGTSNTVMVGEASASSASLTTANPKVAGFSASAAPVYPACAAPAVLVTDPSGQPGDTCMIRSVLLPSERVTVVR